MAGVSDRILAFSNPSAQDPKLFKMKLYENLGRWDDLLEVIKDFLLTQPCLPPEAVRYLDTAVRLSTGTRRNSIQTLTDAQMAVQAAEEHKAHNKEMAVRVKRILAEAAASVPDDEKKDDGSEEADDRPTRDNEGGMAEWQWRHRGEMEDSRLSPEIQMRAIVNYRAAVQRELSRICTEVNKMLDSLIKNVGADDSATLLIYLKLHGDVYRYQTDDGMTQDDTTVSYYIEKACAAYERAMRIAQDKNISVVDVTRLGVVLNCSLLYYHKCGMQNHAKRLIERELSDACQHMDQVDEATLSELMGTLRQLQDTLYGWRDA
eukprot:GHVQ01026481.1.p1 GENE.GHVQ01026481.1~~GHVQ01026481.1.p1  ORF type:complete len:319 (-),score=48.58 GHVQ01026481.1:211-1167(-)